MRPRPSLALTLGDPAGVGPELVLKALVAVDPSECGLRVYGNREVLERASKTSGIPVPDVSFVSPGDFAERAGHVVVDLPFRDAATFTVGRVQKCCGAFAVRAIEAAVRDIQAGRCDAVVTCPISKEAIRLAGSKFPGHTEMLAALTHSAQPPVMAFYSDAIARSTRTGGLFVALATIHEPLSRVPSLITAELLDTVLQTTYDAARNIFHAEPRIGVLGLNPHAGENGVIGPEERDIIVPVIENARLRGISIEGPLVPDVAFGFLGAELRGQEPVRPPCDAYIALYHDQGLIPFKLAAFDSGVNVTLGLPIVRTSPDHGTAFDIAGTGRASPGALLAAIRLALRAAKCRRRPS